MAIQYNSLNLPQQMVMSNSSSKAKNYYTYSASGVKLRTEQRYDPTLQLAPVQTTTPATDGFTDYKNTDYVGHIIYETIKSGSTVTNNTKILVDGGYIENGVYYFYQTDHLGNNRMVIKQDGTIIQRSHYYPFGSTFAENTTQEQGKQPYKYNGKELDQMHGLNLYDYSARYYEPAIGRFSSVDPLAEKYYSISPYAYCNNNPLKYIDPTGEEAWPVQREWDKDDAEQYQQFALAKLKEYEGKNINCADLALAILIDYASQEGLALTLTNNAGQEFDSKSDNYNTVEEFKKGYKVEGKEGLQGGVLPGIQSQDIPSNTFTVDRKDAVVGDMQVLSKPWGHVVIYNSVSRDSEGKETGRRRISYGNFDAATGKDKPAKYDKVDYTAADSYRVGVGEARQTVTPTYVPNRSVVHRWKVLKQTN